MHLIDWLIVLLPLVLVAVIGFKTQKYVKGVSDFLSAGRVAGRYVVAVANGEAAMGLISIVAMFELYYTAGMAYQFWTTMTFFVGIFMSLTGFCAYRYRETRAMTMGQFLEIRYSRSFRIFAGILQSISGIINYAIFPAVGARFLVYFCDLPLNLNILGAECPTFMVVMAIFLGVAVFIATMGGQITIMTTDCVQGILSYPIYAIIIVYILMNFSWFNDMAPAMLNRPEGKSMLNPFDISKLRDFNLFYIFAGIFGSIFNRMAWSGTQGYYSAALNAHEQKIGGVLGTWRGIVTTMMVVLLAVSAFTFLNSDCFDKEADIVRNDLAVKAMKDVAGEAEYDDARNELDNYIKTGELSEQAKLRVAKVEAEDAALKERIRQRKLKYGLIKQDDTTPVQQKTEPEETQAESVSDIAKTIIQSEGDTARGKAQTFSTIFGQMRVPLTLKYMFPIGITGAFCAFCVFLLISTDTTYLHSWGSILVQDIILPIRGKPFTPRQQLMLLRILIASVAVFAFVFSSLFSQVDFILMFFAITGAIWLGGAGPCILGGLYWKRGTTAGAFAALLCGSTLAVGGIVMQQIWVDHVVPWLEANNLIANAAIVFETASSPFEPYIQWRMNLEKFPINSQEIYFFSLVSAVTFYVVVSLLTSRKPFNMDRMLHRGKYHKEGEKIEIPKMTWRNAIIRLVGIDSQYSKGDKLLAWSVFGYFFVWCFGSFVVICIWNFISPWPKNWWTYWFYVSAICIPSVIAFISIIWFTIGGAWDLWRMFKRLAAKESNVLDDGRVIGHVSADDVEMIEKLDHVTMPEAHIEEEILREELEEEGDTEDIKNLDEHTKPE